MTPTRRKRFAIIVVSGAVLLGCGEIPGAEDRPASSASSSWDESSGNAITGYGDFSGLRYYEVDWTQVVAAIINCATDQGIPLEPIPPGDGLSFDAVPPEQNELAVELVEACEEGLNLPPFEEPTEADLERRYRQLLASKACLEREGYAISEPPSLESFVDGYGKSSEGSWHPFDDVVFSVSQSEWVRLNEACPPT